MTNQENMFVLFAVNNSRVYCKLYNDNDKTIGNYIRTITKQKKNRNDMLLTVNNNDPSSTPIVCVCCCDEDERRESVKVKYMLYEKVNKSNS